MSAASLFGLFCVETKVTLMIFGGGSNIQRLVCDAMTVSAASRLGIGNSQFATAAFSGSQ
jgi:hypothetical protein